MNNGLFSNRFAFFLIIFSILQISCRTYPDPDIRSRSVDIDYSNLDNWAAHPDKDDPADLKHDNQEHMTYPADVFFVHPTTYTSYKGEYGWNADISDQKLNQQTDETTILYQASAFNSADRVYAPRYRQAHIEAYYSDDEIANEEALDRAYQDVKSAFDYYLDHYNQGRPIIIASHSQGSTHTKRLLQEYFDGTSLLDQLVAAFVIGMPVDADQYESIDPCDTPEDISCLISWRTWRRGHLPKDNKDNDALVTNPLSWTTTDDPVSQEKNKGAILRSPDKIYPHLVDAQSHEGVLWVSKPKFPWSFLFTRKNYHIADINFFYFNIKENVAERINAYTELSK